MRSGISAAIWSGDKRQAPLIAPPDPAAHRLSFLLRPMAGRIWYDGQLHASGALAAGTCLFVPRGVGTRGAMSDPWRVMHVFVPDVFLRRTLDEAGVTRAFEMVPLKPIVDPVISRLAVTIAREISSPDPFGRLALDAAGVQVGLELLRRYSSAGQIPESRLQLTGWQLRQALDFMQAHLVDDVRLADVAGASGLSVYHFCRAFKATTGVPPQHYLRSLRMRKAEELLAGGRARVGETAAALGYHSAGSFARAFKRETGFSPRAFRHRHT